MLSISSRVSLFCIIAQSFYLKFPNLVLDLRGSGNDFWVAEPILLDILTMLLFCMGVLCQ
jgi:hypothetical protein